MKDLKKFLSQKPVDSQTWEEFKKEKIQFERKAKKMHQKAIEDYMREFILEKEKDGKTGGTVELRKNIVLNDGSIMTNQDLQIFRKEYGVEVYNALNINIYDYLEYPN